MPRPILLTLIALALFAGTLLVLSRQNSILKGPQHDRPDYLAFNRSDTKEAQTIMDGWRHDRTLSAAVKKIVLADYLLIIVYTSFLCVCISARRKVIAARAGQRWLAGLLSGAIFLVLAGALLDAIQDTIIFVWVSPSGENVNSLHVLTWLKFRLLGLGILILLFSLLPQRWLTRQTAAAGGEILSGVLKSLWLFFPSILFILLTIVCFWQQTAGKDILVAFTESTNRGFRVVFFFVIGFWVYVTWYTSRVIAYIKEMKRPFIPTFLYNFPRLAGNACFLVIELAALQAPVLEHRLPAGTAIYIFLAAMTGLYFVDKWISPRLQQLEDKLSPRFWMVFAVFFVILLITCFVHVTRAEYIYLMVGLLLLLHLIYLVYVNLHRVMVYDADNKRLRMDESTGIAEKLMAFFCIPIKEKGFIKWLLATAIVSIIIYVIAINHIGFARGIGPFSIVILGFAVLLGFGNLVTALSVRLNLNFHFLFLLLALLVNRSETHEVRQMDLPNRTNGYKQRPHLEAYLRTWLKRVPANDSAFDVYFVMSNGGASRSGYWTASVLGKLEDSSRKMSPCDPFSNHVICLSGTSGGGVGVAPREDAGAGFFQLYLPGERAERPGKGPGTRVRRIRRGRYLTRVYAAFR